MTVPLTVDPATHASQIKAHNSLHFLTKYVDERCSYIFSGSFLWFCSYTVGFILHNQTDNIHRITKNK
jgi:hypothetical protein